LIELSFTTGSDDAGSEGGRVGAAGVKGIITAVGSSDGGVGECVVELVDSTSTKVPEDARNDAMNLRMLVIFCQYLGDGRNCGNKMNKRSRNCHSNG
jgi:hypothetical protein